MASSLWPSLKITLKWNKRRNDRVAPGHRSQSSVKKHIQHHLDSGLENHCEFCIVLQCPTRILQRPCTFAHKHVLNYVYLDEFILCEWYTFKLKYCRHHSYRWVAVRAVRMAAGTNRADENVKSSTKSINNSSHLRQSLSNQADCHCRYVFI